MRHALRHMRLTRCNRLGFSSSNAGNIPWGMGGVDHTSNGCTVQRMLRAMSDTPSSLHLIQERKLGASAYSSHAAFNGTLSEQWQWLVWPGKCIRQQGLAALVSVEHVLGHKRRVVVPQDEVAYVGLDLWASGTTVVAINVYFEPGQSLAHKAMASSYQRMRPGMSGRAVITIGERIITHIWQSRSC